MIRVLSAFVLLWAASLVGAQTTTVIAITNQDLIATAEARLQTKYLASCALDGTTMLAGTSDGERYEFPGAMSLAPDWGKRALTISERRWVSACILARTNFYGAHVLISMRAEKSGHASLDASPEEYVSHTLFEGGFFGDIFTESGGAFVCVGPAHDADQAAQSARKRVCTHPAAPGSNQTRCGFLQTGLCPANAPPSINGAPWPEVIHVWLAAQAP